MILTGYEIHKDILAGGMIGPDYLSPRHAHLVCAAFAQRMLAEEQHEAGPVLIEGSSMLLNKPDTFNNVG
jgi:hypothetical protein